MKENKGKGIAGDESVQPKTKAPAQTCLFASSTLKLVPLASSKKRKTVSKKLDIGNLPSSQGNKKQKVDFSTPFTTPIVVLDLAASVAKPTISKGKGSLSHPDVDSAKPSPTRPPDSGPMTFLRSEGLPWDKFKQVVTDKDIAICYDMSVKEFERSTVHDLFKVF